MGGLVVGGPWDYSVRPSLDIGFLTALDLGLGLGGLDLGLGLDNFPPGRNTG